MKPISATITSKGQTTIPKEIREVLHLQPGDRVDFVMDGNRVYLQPVNRDAMELSGILYEEDRRPLSLGEMEEAIAAGACESAGMDS